MTSETASRVGVERAPIIGITSYSRDEMRRFRVSVDYVDAIRRAGGVPVILPPGDPRQAEFFDLVDAFVLSGGGDVDPACYHGPNHPTLRDMDAERDASEVPLALQIVETGIPALLICRGAQILNVALGGTLHAHLPDVVGEEVPHRKMAKEAGETAFALHPVDVVEGTRLAAVLGEPRPVVASWHHQAPRDLAPGLVAAARAADGVIEALELPGHPFMIGVQWHPEITAGNDLVQQRLFDALVEAARERMRGTAVVRNGAPG